MQVYTFEEAEVQAGREGCRQSGEGTESLVRRLDQ